MQIHVSSYKCQLQYFYFGNYKSSTLHYNHSDRLVTCILNKEKLDPEHLMRLMQNLTFCLLKKVFVYLYKKTELQEVMSIALHLLPSIIKVF